MVSLSRLLVFLIVLSHATAQTLDLHLVADGQPLARIEIGVHATSVEQYAASELQHFLETYTGTRLPVGVEPEGEMPNVIRLATPESFPEIPPVEGLDDVGPEGYRLQSIPIATGVQVTIAGPTPRGVLYGVYAFLEACVEQITGLRPVSPDFDVTPVDTLTLPPISRQGEPFFPRRVSLAPKSPDWLARHRFNISGAEGVWSGTGSDDGLGTAVKYLTDPVFEDLQDESLDLRIARQQALHERLGEMAQRGIDTYLFMYVTGEPTEAMVALHPEWFSPRVAYGDSRNRRDYAPFCWSDPGARAFLRSLVQALLREYPELSGLHFRSWGAETRASQNEQCGDTSPAGQELLWDLYFDLIDAGRAVRPDVQFYISGYDRSWLKDPERSHAAQLPPGTILTQKWGFDGEPTSDTGISIEMLEAFGETGQQMVVLSHNVEEVAPFWMVESDLFAEGVRSLVDDPRATGLAGFTLQGTLGFGYLDQLVSGLLNWDPQASYLDYMHNYLATRYGSEATPLILDALQTNAEVLSDYFAHYAHSLAISGAYGAGSSGTASRFWSIIGAETVEDALAIPEFYLVEKAHTELAQLSNRQRQARQRMESAETQFEFDPSPAAMRDYRDGQQLMRLWEHFFACRRALVDAVWLGWTGGSREAVEQNMQRALDESMAMALPIREYQQYFLLFGYSEEGMRRLLLDDLETEWPVIEGFDWTHLDRAPPDVQFEVEDGDGWLTRYEITLRIKAEDRFSGIGPEAHIRFREDEGKWTDPTPYADRQPWTLEPHDGRHTLSVTISDDLGNWSPPLSVDVLVDTTPPYGSVRPANPNELQSERRTRLHINAFDAMSRIGPGSQIRLSHDGVTWQDPIPYTPLVEWEWSPEDGEKRVYALFQDEAGNWMTQPVSAKILLDTTPPGIARTIPAADARDVDFRIWSIEIQLTEQPDLRATPTLSVIGQASGPIGITTVVEGDMIRLHLAQTPAPQERVTVTLLSRIPDAARNMLSAGFQFSFETASALLPGDCNRDGRVDVDDLHTVIAYMGQQGPARSPSGWRKWLPQPVPRWMDEQAAYADANGDGTVNAVDVLPISLHWGHARPWVAGLGNWELSRRYLAEYGEMADVLAHALTDTPGISPLQGMLEAILHPAQPEFATQPLPPYPNPSSGVLWIPFELAESLDVTVRIYDLQGRVIRRLPYPHMPPGAYVTPGTALRWDGENADGETIAAGAYWVEVRLGEERTIWRVQIVR